MIGAALFAAAWLGTAAPAAPAVPASGLPSQEAAADGSLRVFLVTLGPGAEVWERFGHNAIWIHDPAAGTDRAYHYGLFDMSEAGFLTEFLQGRMAYSMGAADASRLIDAYRAVGREATIQELSMPGPRIRDLQRFLEWNLQPENRVYRYDYFQDNCSTRVRDALDRALGGTLVEILAAEPTGITYRLEALTLTGQDRLLTAGLDLGLGPLADQALTRWELAFIPMRLRDALRDVAVERDGRAVPLVIDERSLPALGAPDEQIAAPGQAVSLRTLGMLFLGVLIGGAFALLGRLAAGGARAARLLLSVAGAAWGLLAGLLGVILLALWTLTDHEFAHANENLLQANPLALLLVVLIPLAISHRGARSAAVLAAVLAVLSLVGLLLHPLPATPQANLAIIALAAPIHLGVLHAVTTLKRERFSSG